MYEIYLNNKHITCLQTKDDVNNLIRFMVQKYAYEGEIILTSEETSNPPPIIELNIDSIGFNEWMEEDEPFHSCLVNFDANNNPLCPSISLEDGECIKIYDMANIPSEYVNFCSEGDPIIRVKYV